MKPGWEIRTLGEVCEFQNGFAFKSSTFTDTGEPIIRISDIQNDEVIDTNVVYFNPSSYHEDLSRFIVYPGDILIAMSGGTTGKLGMNNTQRCFYLNQRVGVFRENKALLNHEFLFHFLHTKSEESLRISAGAAQPNLSTAQIKAFEIPVPSLTEQQRIVDILDREFAKIDALKTNAEKSLQAAKDLFQATLKKELEPREGWKSHKLNEIYDVRDGTHDSPQYHLSGYPLATSKNLRNGIVDLSNVKLISKQDYDKINERSKVDVGDVLFAMIGTIGNPCLVETEPNYAIKNMALFKVPKNQSGKLLKYILSTDDVLNEMRGQSKGANQPFVSLGYLRNYIITIPNSFDEQLRLVVKLDDLNDKCNALQENYQKTLALCDDLKQALLRKAFNGEL